MRLRGRPAQCFRKATWLPGVQRFSPPITSSNCKFKKNTKRGDSRIVLYPVSDQSVFTMVKNRQAPREERGRLWGGGGLRGLECFDFYIQVENSAE